MARPKVYRYSDKAPFSPLFEVWVEGCKAGTLATESDHFACYEAEGPHEVVLDLPEGWEPASLSPLRLATPWKVEGRKATLHIPGPGSWCLQGRQGPSLFLYVHPPQSEDPAPGAKIFREGDYVQAGALTLGEGEGLVIEGGAVVEGIIRANRAHGARISGRGVLVASGARQRSVLIERSEQFQLKDLTIINPTSWMVTLAGCRDSEIAGLREIGTCLSSDGVDIVGCQRIRVRDCCLRNGDDCLVVKSLPIPGLEESSDDLIQDVEDIEFSRCILMNHAGGSATEIGYELRCSRVSNIRFREIDVLGVHHHGSVFGIHNSDHALVEKVSWEKVWVEHHYDKLIDFRVVESRWGRTAERGRIRDVSLKDIEVTMNDFNWGYTTSLIGGWDSASPVEGVTLEDLRFNGKPVTDPDTLCLYTKQAQPVRFL